MILDHDGVRLITNEVCDFLQKVPEVTDEVFRFGTESPASILLDAVEQLENQSPKADDNIQLIRPNLVEAVDTCVSLYISGSLHCSLLTKYFRLKLPVMNLASIGKSSFSRPLLLVNRCSISITVMILSTCVRHCAS
jgi:hypothetical protein